MAGVGYLPTTYWSEVLPLLSVVHQNWKRHTLIIEYAEIKSLMTRKLVPTG